MMADLVVRKKQEGRGQDCIGGGISCRYAQVQGGITSFARRKNNGA